MIVFKATPEMDEAIAAVHKSDGPTALSFMEPGVLYWVTSVTLDSESAEVEVELHVAHVHD